MTEQRVQHTADCPNRKATETAELKISQTKQDKTSHISVFNKQTKKRNLNVGEETFSSRHFKILEQFYTNF
jgi:hypothetical protein